jgi:dephospho-CoA kinase
LLDAQTLCEAKGEQCVLDIPLFYETQGAYPDAKVAVVYATPAQQKARIMARNGWSEQEALARIGVQLPIEEKRQKADFVITNTGDETALVEEVKRFYAWLKGEKCE